MKRLIALLVLLLSISAAFGEEKKTDDKKTDDYNTVREFRNKMFDVHNRDPRTILGAITLLGSGFKGASVSVNDELRTITVRDFPENIAAIQEAITRLDHPAAETPDIELKISVLIGSKTPLNGAAIPEDLAPVVKQLQSTLRYASYGLLTTAVQRTRPGVGIEGSGVVETALIGMTAPEGKPILYSYSLRHVTVSSSGQRQSIDVEHFNFAMRIPINMGTSTQYQSVGFDTAVSIRENEKVVIGTTTMGDKALIVVVTASIRPAAQ